MAVDGGGFDQMVATFLEWGLPAPPVPASLRPVVAARDRACWASRPTSGLEMYYFREPVAELCDGPVDEYVAVSHAGHGFNSYAISYTLVYRGVALYAQEAWGGAFMDAEAATRSVAAMFDGAAALIEAAEARAPEDGAWLVCVANGLRRADAAGWVRVPTQESGGFGPLPAGARTAPGEALRVAVALAREG